jgi:hypothetical protein
MEQFALSGYVVDTSMLLLTCPQNSLWFLFHEQIFSSNIRRSQSPHARIQQVSMEASA